MSGSGFHSGQTERFLQREGGIGLLTCQAIARATRGRIISGWVRAPGPGHSRHDDSLAIKPDATAPLGLVFRSFAGDDDHAVIEHLRALGLVDYRKRRRRFKNSPMPAPQPTLPQEEGRRAEAQRLWARAEPSSGTLAQVYMRARGYGGPMPTTIRFIPAGKLSAHPLLVAACGNATQGEEGSLGIEVCDVMALMRIYLSNDGRRKAAIEVPKRSLGPIKAHPCWVRGMGDGLSLAITEGIEDALSLAWPLGVGGWACGGASNFRHAAARVPAYVECVLLGEDQNDAGRRGCDELSEILLGRTNWLAGRPPSIRRVRVWEGVGA